MVLLVIAGAAVIGYMVLAQQGWQHHKQSNQDTGHQAAVATQKELCAQNEKLCVHYPSSWQAKAGQATGGDGKHHGAWWWPVRAKHIPGRNSTEG